LYHAAPGHALPLGAALAVAIGALGAYVVASAAATAAGASSLTALAVGQCAMGALVLGVARALGQPARAVGIAPAAPALIAAAALIGASLWLINVALVSALFTVESRDLEHLTPVVHRPPLAPVLLGVAVAPAICEELVFRGALLRGLAARMPAAAALALSSSLFALYHVSPVRLLPTLTLGLALGALTLRAGSIAPAILGHLINNAIVIAVERDPGGPLARAIAAEPEIALAASAALVGAGLALTARAAPASRSRPAPGPDVVS
jgi:sodium transport system permease protein